MSDTTGNGYEPPKQYRTRAEADRLRVEALKVVQELERRLPADLFSISEGTLFVAREIPQEVACFAVGLPGIKYAVSAVTFELGGDFEETVGRLVKAGWRWRKRTEAEAAQASETKTGDASDDASAAH